MKSSWPGSDSNSFDSSTWPARLSPGQVGLSPGHQLVVRRLELGVQGAEFLVAELGQGHGRFRWS
jgi:hypothetical protein